MGKQIAVIGLGRFGESLSLELMQYGVDVFAIDCDEECVNNISANVTQAVIADTTLEKTVAELDLKQFDSVFIAIGDDTKASILTTLIVKEAGAHNIWVKSKDKFHEKILRKIGADHIINPERDMGKRISRQLLSNLFFDYLDLGDETAIAEFKVGDAYIDKEIIPLAFEKKHNVSLLAIKRGGEIIKTTDSPLTLKFNDIAVVAGCHENINVLLNSF